MNWAVDKNDWARNVVVSVPPKVVTSNPFAHRVIHIEKRYFPLLTTMV